MSAQWLVAGCGYVGAALVRQELRSERSVVAVARSTEVLRGNIPHADVNWWSLDLSAWDTLPAQLPVAPWVSVFLVSPGVRQPQQEAVYLRALRNWNQWCSQLGISLRIMAGSSGIYEQTSGEWVDESSPLETVSERALALRRAEECFWESLSLDAVGVLLRIAGIYGPNRYRFLQSLSSSGSDTWLNLIYLDDLVAALQACAQGMRLHGKTVEGSYNLSDGAPVLRSELTHWLASRYEVPDSERTARRHPRGNAHRRISSQHFQRTFQWSPRYTHYQEGYQQIFSLTSNNE